MNLIALDNYLVGNTHYEDDPITQCGECGVEMYEGEDVIEDENKGDYLCTDECWQDRIYKENQPKKVRLSEFEA